ncbi:hypothetical protein KIPB_003676 [Kipferlia bialata]|uniref:RNA cytidine acetyltransferase n=1 Tax=Kipferlia bialata TaxID=797122 RepID=A0A9K3CU87_9EUKA|nr:hypothetical protein KIPB_003676 [Kipferlia bialata]|eukprot:g3676.t1
MSIQEGPTTTRRVDSRVIDLIRNCVRTRHRSVFVVLGEEGKQMIVKLHYFLSRERIKRRPTVLWCYQNELGFVSAYKKRLRKMRKAVGKANFDEGADSFHLFLTSTDIRFCYYKETASVLGQTYGMCVLQDLHSLSPSSLCRAVETVEGGGVVVLLAEDANSLSELQQLTLSAHSRLAPSTGSSSAEHRYMSRLILGLARSPACLTVNAQLDVLPVTKAALQPLSEMPDSAPAPSLEKLAQSAGSEQLASLVSVCVTEDQGHSVLKMLECISHHKQKSLVSLTAARGRGKSAALGLSLAGAIAYGYSQVCVVAPDVRNVGTVFEFALRGLAALGYSEITDYDVTRTQEGDITGITAHRAHRQSVLYCGPENPDLLRGAELVLIDEAASIPTKQVRALLGPRLTLLSSTVHGYEGTGRSLALKLIADIKRRPQDHSLTELVLHVPIRYNASDPVESVVNDVMLLECEKALKSLGSAPDPRQCELYSISRDTLLSGHPAAEAFLREVWALFVSSHYKNSPDDLLLLADSPSQRLFVLLAPIDVKDPRLVPLAAIQCGLEGGIAEQAAGSAISRGERPAGDMLPWTLASMYRVPGFAALRGIRTVRIAVRPGLQGMGYGGRALERLRAYYSGDIPVTPLPGPADEGHCLDFKRGMPVPAKKLPPLLLRLQDREPEQLDWLGVSFGATAKLTSFWRQAGYVPVHMRLSSSATTGEHSLALLRPISSEAQRHITVFSADLRRRVFEALSGPLRSLSLPLALELTETQQDERPTLAREVLGYMVPALSRRRLEAHFSGSLDLLSVDDILPPLCRIALLHAPITITPAQTTVLLGIGAQRRSLMEVGEELGIPASQCGALLTRSLRRVHAWMREGEKADAAAALGLEEAGASQKMQAQTLASKDEVEMELGTHGRAVIDGFERYAVPADIGASVAEGREGGTLQVERRSVPDGSKRRASKPTKGKKASKRPRH